MNQLFEASFSVVNLVPTFLMLLVIFYWFIALFGFVDPDADLSKDKDFHFDHGTGMSGLSAALAFFNIGQVPIMLFVSLFALPLWIMSVLFNHYTNNESWFMSLIMLIPFIIASLFVAKFLTSPFTRLFSKMHNDIEKPAKVIGRVCTIQIPVSHTKTGQGLVKDRDNTLMLNITTLEGTYIEKGKSALIIQYNEQKKCYLVEPYENL